MKFVPFSKKQKQILTWWTGESPHKDKAGIIVDGSIRSGKTVMMFLSFILWSFDKFDDQYFGIAGKTIASCMRNVVTPGMAMLKGLKYNVKYNRTENLLTIAKGKKVNHYYIFGGRDESSQYLVQGVTLAGVLIDEVAITPESFVNQLTARCSVDGSKLWFNCNPEGKNHWFKVGWINEAEANNMALIHFRLYDNPSLSEEKIKFYNTIYKGVFYKRFVLGEWVAAEGSVYMSFIESQEEAIIQTLPDNIWFTTIGIDFGGNKSATTLKCTGFTPGFKQVIAIEEKKIEGINNPHKLEKAFVKFVRKQLDAGYKVLDIRADSAEQTLIRGLQDALVQEGIFINVNNAIKGEINDRISFYNLMFGAGVFKIYHTCTDTIDAFNDAVYDPKKFEDTRLDNGTSDIDSLDAQEYTTEPYMKQIIDMIERQVK